MNQAANQMKYGQKKAVNFTIDQQNYACKIMIQKCNQHIMKKNLLLLKDLLEPKKTKFIFFFVTLVSKNVYIDKLKDIYNKYNKKSYRTIKTKPADLRSSTYTDFG